MVFPKAELIKLILLDLQQDFERLTKIALDARADAISSEMKQEGKFDTRAIEAGYLASAQGKRLFDLKNEMTYLQGVSLIPREKIGVGSVVKVMSDELKKCYFLAPVTGGKTYSLGEEKVTIISPGSPLGEKITNLQKGDNYIFNLNSQKRDWEIEEIF